VANVPVTRKDSILDQVEQVRHRIAERAHDLFRQRKGLPGDPAVDWLAAEQETVWKPAVELRETNGIFTVVAALPGVEAKDIGVDVSVEDVVIKGSSAHSCSRTEGQVHRCEFATGELFRSVHFPKPVDAAKAKAEYRNGLLTVTVPAVSPAGTKPGAVQAA
jgi:HSP20 family molecular chaperone IbpA